MTTTIPAIRYLLSCHRPAPGGDYRKAGSCPKCGGDPRRPKDVPADRCPADATPDLYPFLVGSVLYRDRVHAERHVDFSVAEYPDLAPLVLIDRREVQV